MRLCLANCTLHFSDAGGGDEFRVMTSRCVVTTLRGDGDDSVEGSWLWKLIAASNLDITPIFHPYPHLVSANN